MSSDREYPWAFIREIGMRVAAKAQQCEGDLWKARREVSKTLSRSEQYTLVLFALGEAEKFVFRKAHPFPDGEGGHLRPDAQLSSAPFSRRAEAMLDRDPLLYIVAIGSSGERKPIGECTREDLDVMAAYWGATKRAYGRKEAGYRSIAEKVTPGKTLASCASKLSVKDLEFLRADLGISGTREPTPTSAVKAVA